MKSHKDLVTQLIHNLSFDQAEIEFQDNQEDFNINITLPQEESGVLIGFRGEKIDALQYIFTLILNHESISYKPVNLDINQYRHQRHQTLYQMADTAATKASESGREILLPPMSPSERRLIHIHLAENPSVSTYSEGEAASRHIVVRPDNSDSKNQ